MFRSAFLISLLFFTCALFAREDSIDVTLESIHDSLKIDFLFGKANEVQYTDASAYLRYSEKARDASLAARDTVSLAKAELNIGYYFLDKSEFKKSLTCFLRSLSLNEKVHYKKGISNCLFSLGNLYYYMNDAAIALKYYSRAFPIYKELNDVRGLALVSNAIGVIYMDQQQYKLAVEYFGNALSYYEQVNDKVSQGQVLTNMSYVFTQTEDYKKALNMAMRGIEVAGELKDHIGMAKGLVSAGEIYTAMHDWNNAMHALNEALRISVVQKDKNLERMIYTSLSAMCREKGDYKNALEYFEKGIHIKDSIFSIETTNQMLELQTRFETDKKEKEIQLLTKDKERDKVIKSAFVGGLSLLALLSFYIYRNYRIKRKANEELISKNLIIEEKNKNISDSINYAKRIQEAILPATSEMNDVFSDHFILYKPKDVVSGDFYAFARKESKVIFAAVDCTGHGVPGAFMSMIGTDKLNHIVIEQGITKPSEILNQLNLGIKTALKQRDADSGETRDGMDLALCMFDTASGTLEFAGAHRPLYHINGELKIVDADKTAIGGWTDENYSFTNHQVEVKKGDCIYLFSDGYADQFGGPKQKKFTTKRFKELLFSIRDKSMEEQKAILNETIEHWKGDLEQVDDILVVGVRI